jgi:gliding motility-associated-like protein
MKFFLTFILFSFFSESLLSQTVTASFTAPDTVCTNASVQINNTSVGASNYYWSFCEANFNTAPIGTDFGNPGGLLSLPVFLDIAQDASGNYFAFVINNSPGGLIRMNFGNSLLNTPTVDNMGNFGGAIPQNAEGIQAVNVNGDWLLIIDGGDPASGVPSAIVKIDLGTSLASTTGVATNWGNIGNMAYPHDIYLFNENNNWYGYTVNSENNTITQFNFGTDFSMTPTGTNLGNFGNFDTPVGLGVINNAGTWHLFIANNDNNTITRLDFGNSLLNTPTGVNIGNPGNNLDNPRDISFVQLCNNTEAYVVNATSNTITQLDFGTNLSGTPIVTNLGNVGNLNFPHSISKLFRVNSDVYAFVPNVYSNGITQLHFSGCSTPGSTLQNPANVTYSSPGTYNINLLVDLGLPTQTSFCKQIVVKDCPLDACSDWLHVPSDPSYVNIGNLNVPGNQITVEAMVNLTTPFTGGPTIGSDVVTKYNNPSDINYLLRFNNAYITTDVGFFGTPDFCANDTNKTYHIAMVYDGATLKFYRNGFLMSYVPATGNLYQNNWQTWIGNYFSQIYNTNFIGYINEVRIWNVARTQAQIRNYMNTSLPSPTTQTGLLAYYIFNDLLNKQGNTAWNGTLGGSASINQTNPKCVFVADSCCPVLNGSLNGSSACKGSQAFLTFNTTTTTGPFTLTYANGIDTFTSNKVQNNIPFALATAPLATTKYILLSIKDTSSCAPTTVVGDTATVTITDCSNICTSSHCPLVNNLVINTGYNAATQTSLQPGQQDSDWIVTAISNDMKNAFCSGNTTNPTPPPSGTVVTPVSVGQPSLAIQALPAWPSTGTYVSCFPFNTPYTVPPPVSNYTNCTMGITRTFYVCSSNSTEAVNFNLTISTDDLTQGVIIDAGTPNAIILSNGGSGFLPPITINTTENLSPGMHTLTIEGANYEDVNGSYFNLPSGASAQWNPFGIAVTGTITSANSVFVSNACSITSTGLCTGSLGDPVVNITFGSGNNPGQDLPTIVPGASTTLTYVAVTGNPATPTPVDGQYTITNNVPTNADWFSDAYDHTSKNGTGYMAFYNASEQPGEFYRQTVNNLCGSTTYEFAAWIANVLDPSKVIGVNPDITFRIEQTDGTLLASYDTGPIGQNSTFTWQQFGLYFTTPSNISTVVLRMINNNPGGTANLGNDLAIDDITFRPCGPLITASFDATTIVDSISVCQQSNVKLYGSAGTGYTSPGYLWQYSSDSGKTWIDIANSNSLQINITAPLTASVKNFKYRMLSGEGTNINSTNCRVSSNLIILNVSPGPQGKLSAANICAGNNANIVFTSSSLPSPFSITWTDGTNSYSQPNLNNNSSFISSFTLNNTATYKLHSITDANGCTNTPDSPFVITVNPLPKGYLTGNDICSGDDANLLFTATSGTSLFNITYSSNGNAYSKIGIDNNSTFTIPFALNDTTIFTLTSITDANGCTSSLDTTAAINVLSLPQGGLAGGSACIGDSAGITFNATNGIGSFELEISDGTNTTIYYDVQSGVTFKISPVAQTTTLSLVSITDKDGNGCSRTDGFSSPTATIIAKPSPQIKFDPLTPICIQQSAFLITQATETTGIAGSGAFSGDGVDVSGNFSPSDAGVGVHKIIYTYAATNGCTASDSSNITVNSTPIVNAGQDIVGCIGFPIQLNATGASTYIWSPVTGLNNPSITNPIATIDTTTTYIVQGTDSNGCYASDTITVNIGKNGIAAFVVPSAFTPNGDGVNDCFGIRRWGGVEVVEFSIFNRWGQLVFTTKNPSDCWDGTFQGKQQPTGGYPYIIKAKTPCGDLTRTGIVMLIR